MKLTFMTNWVGRINVWLHMVWAGWAVVDCCCHHFGGEAGVGFLKQGDALPVIFTVEVTHNMANKYLSRKTGANYSSLISDLSFRSFWLAMLKLYTLTITRAAAGSVQIGLKSSRT